MGLVRRASGQCLTQELLCVKLSLCVNILSHLHNTVSVILGEVSKISVFLTRK